MNTSTHSPDNVCKVGTYVPHGDIPDKRGYAPAVVAYYLGKNLINYNNIFIVNNENNGPRHETCINGEIFRIKESIAYTRLFKKLTRLDPYPLHKRAAKIANQLDLQIFHAHQLEIPIRDFKRHLNNKRTKIVVHAHAIRRFEPELGTADCYIAVSEYTKERLIKEFGYPDQLVQVLYNGVDTTIFRPGTKQEKIHIKKELGIVDYDLPVLGYIGRRQESKGYYDFLKTVESLNKRGLKFIAICAGATPPIAKKEENYFCSKDLCEKLVQQKKLISLDALPHDQLSKLYRIIDVLQFYTHFNGEQHPVVMVEAMASGCIVIATNFAGIPETITHQINGFLIDKNSPSEKLINQTEILLARLDNFSNVRICARNEIVQNYSWASLGHKLELIYNLL